ncbi:MAG: deoxyribonuclease V [Chloroflexi bacterium]|nr:deoxyribonuclease V [Chloroflexota bacterium]
MKITLLHSWEVSPAEGRRIQEELHGKLIATWDGRAVRSVAGVDVGLEDDTARAAVVVLSYPELAPLQESAARVPVRFPYIPGLLAFREGPAILAALEKLRSEPDLFLFDGQGTAHPRRLGIASHIGVILDVPAIGCAKSLLIGNYHEPSEEAGSYSNLYDREEVVGAVVRTRRGVQPVYVSVGHLIDLENAIDFVLKCCRGYRLPEPLRWALHPGILLIYQ